MTQEHDPGPDRVTEMLVALREWVASNESGGERWRAWDEAFDACSFSDLRSALVRVGSYVEWDAMRPEDWGPLIAG